MKPHRAKLRAAAFCGAALCCLGAGCGETDLGRVIVEGEITYQGEPVNNGDILFSPLDETRGPAAGAAIKDGFYVAEAKGGVPVGKHRVEIRGFRAAPAAGPPPAPGPEGYIPPELEGGRRVQYLPKRYNGPHSELVVTVEGDRRRITRDFHLE